LLTHCSFEQTTSTRAGESESRGNRIFQRRHSRRRLLSAPPLSLPVAFGASHLKKYLKLEQKMIIFYKFKFYKKKLVILK